MFDIFLAALTEYLQTKQDYTAALVSEEELTAAKKRLAESLNEYIDFRVEASWEDRRRHISQERVKLADDINTTIKSTASAVRTITALNSAPAPPIDVTDPKKMKAWQEKYSEWYETQRKKGITIG